MYRPSHPATGVSYYSPPMEFPSAGYPFVGPASYGVPYVPSGPLYRGGCPNGPFVGAAPGEVVGSVQNPNWVAAGYPSLQDCATAAFRMQFGESGPAEGWDIAIQACSKAAPAPAPAPSPSRPPSRPPSQPPPSQPPPSQFPPQQGSAGVPYWRAIGYQDVNACVTDSVASGWSQADSVSMCNDTQHGYGSPAPTPIPQGGAGSAASGGIGAGAVILGLLAVGALVAFSK